MSLQLFAAWFISLSLLIVGLSHILQPRAWVAFFTDLLARPYAGLVIAMFTLPYGLLGVLAHNTWAFGTGLIVTVVAWGWTLKGALYLLAPRLAAIVARPHVDKPSSFAVAGGVCVALGGVSLAGLLTR